MSRPRFSRRRGAAAISGLLAVAALAVAAGIAAADSGSPKAGATTSATAPAKSAADASKAPDPGVPSGLLAETRQGLDGLVADGAINESQADAIQSRIESGHIDVTEVISSGVLDEAQMQRVNDVLRPIKLAHVGP